MKHSYIIYYLYMFVLFAIEQIVGWSSAVNAPDRCVDCPRIKSHSGHFFYFIAINSETIKLIKKLLKIFKMKSMQILVIF